MIGIDRLIRLDWLERTVNLLLAGNKEKEIETILNETLALSFTASSPNTLRGSLSKTVTILMKTWVRVPDELMHLRNKGIDLLRKTPADCNLPLHWGMISAVYPFWSNVATQVGRLLKLQGNVAAAQIQRRLQEQYGQKETVARRTRYLLRTFIDWQVLSDSTVRGVYNIGKQISIEKIEIISWLIEAFLYARPHNSIILNELLNSPSLFPFHLKPITTENLQAASSNIEFLRHGFDDNLVILREQKVRTGRGVTQ
ncbi:MAG: hypothetical protein H8D67_20225 [Deltaproteobacteria bacterium]|nr:hypothetical protein [Deltaproteobacteria bacterium]